MPVINILIIGPSITRTKGGMATVIQDALTLNGANPDFKFAHLVSHVEGGLWERISLTFKSLLHVWRNKNTYDVVHIHVASKGSFYRKSLFVHLCRLLGKPIVLHVHGADFDKFYLGSPSLLRRYIRYTFASVNRVFVLSVFWRDFFQKHIAANNVMVVHNGVNVDSFAACITPEKTFNDFLFLGRLGKRKGVYDLLQAIRMIVQHNPETQMHFWLAGDGEVEEVRALVNQYEMAHWVSVVGWIDGQQKLEYLRRSDTMILPSYDEGLPMSILESMACGKIIISTYVGGIPDLVQNGENGFLIQPGDVQALYEKLLEVNRDKNRMEAISENNIHRIRAHYNLKSINQDILQTYKELYHK